MKQNLRAQHILIDETCDLCGDHQETLLHSLWLCDHAQIVWKSDPGFAPLYQKQYRKFEDLVEELMHRDSTYQVALSSTIGWCLWQCRNRLKENPLTWQLHELGNRAKELVLEYLDVKK
ncbi:hypothetical protein RGQ29_009977 [Quercus rubra]|uniref:Reverse transcriptase zinc-binding domain-containing protein n=1 Tax=Quercus rubra TaxID=3512 RepID=A0AAN7FZA2_QUERU|nr:hypothetical protein RGQ29_009977 [Quercus rubra]